MELFITYDFFKLNLKDLEVGMAVTKSNFINYNTHTHTQYRCGVVLFSMQNSTPFATLCNHRNSKTLLTKTLVFFINDLCHSNRVLELPLPRYDGSP